LLGQHHFLLRRLHSLSGIIPVGVFVIAHLFTNAQMLWGQPDPAVNPEGMSMFQHEVDFIHSIPALLFIEIALWGSIAFHAGLGLVYTFTGKSNTQRYAYMDNWRYTLQRVTGIVALVFIFLHIATLRWRWDILGWFTPFYGEGYQAPQLKGNEELSDAKMALPLTAYALQFSWVVVAFYAVGAFAVVYHWSNGLWTSAITWGLTISTGAQKRWGYACAGLGVALTVFMTAAIVGAMAYDLRTDTTQEQREAMTLIAPGWYENLYGEPNPYVITEEETSTQPPAAPDAAEPAGSASETNTGNTGDAAMRLGDQSSTQVTLSMPTAQAADDSLTEAATP